MAKDVQLQGDTHLKITYPGRICLHHMLYIPQL